MEPHFPHNIRMHSIHRSLTVSTASCCFQEGVCRMLSVVSVVWNQESLLPRKYLHNCESGLQGLEPHPQYRKVFMPQAVRVSTQGLSSQVPRNYPQKVGWSGRGPKAVSSEPCLCCCCWSQEGIHRYWVPAVGLSLQDWSLPPAFPQVCCWCQKNIHRLWI